MGEDHRQKGFKEKIRKGYEEWFEDGRKKNGDMVGFFLFSLGFLI